MKALIFLCCAAFLAASLVATAATPPPKAADEEKYGVYPIAYRELITRWLEDRLLDAASAKLEFTEPQAGEMTREGRRFAGYMVEFKVNSRNRFGMYTGFQGYRVVIRNGELIWSERARR